MHLGIHKLEIKEIGALTLMVTHPVQKIITRGECCLIDLTPRMSNAIKEV